LPIDKVDFTVVAEINKFIEAAVTAKGKGM